jgi:hypothetical protein
LIFWHSFGAKLSDLIPWYLRQNIDASSDASQMIGNVNSQASESWGQLKPLVFGGPYSTQAVMHYHMSFSLRLYAESVPLDASERCTIVSSFWEPLRESFRVCKGPSPADVIVTQRDCSVQYDSFGELAVLNGATRGASVITTTVTELLVLTRWDAPMS